MKRTEVHVPKSSTANGLYTYRQNNSGGTFTVNDNVTVNVYVEAANSDEADMTAQLLGIYFAGNGDCPCCGNRWDHACAAPDWMNLAELEEKIREADAAEGWRRMDTWVERGEPFAHIYMKDGRKITYTKD